jgi:pimeloyl-ACP methyl ester carboxylesterase
MAPVCAATEPHQQIEIPGTGHFVMMEKPEEFNRLVTAFVDRIKF